MPRAPCGASEENLHVFATAVLMSVWLLAGDTTCDLRQSSGGGGAPTRSVSCHVREERHEEPVRLATQVGGVVHTVDDAVELACSVVVPS